MPGRVSGHGTRVARTADDFGSNLSTRPLATVRSAADPPCSPNKKLLGFEVSGLNLAPWQHFTTQFASNPAVETKCSVMLSRWTSMFLQLKWRIRGRKVEGFVVTNLHTAVVGVPLLDIVGQMMQCRFNLKRDPRVFTRFA